MDAGKLEVLRSGARGDVDDPSAFFQRDLVPGDDPVLEAGGGGEVVEGPLVRESDQLGAGDRLHRDVVRIAGPSHPRPVLAQDVVGVGLDRRGHVRRQGPRRGCPDD